MNKIILFLLTFIPTILFGQETKKFTDKKTNETFYVLKSDKTTRHGEYKKFSYKNKLLVRGYYKLGVKDTIWECFDHDGQLNLKFDYSKNELVFYKPGDGKKDTKYKILIGGISSDVTLSRPPIFLGGDDFIASEVAKNLRYPVIALENGITSNVNVVFTVDTFGKTSNYHVEKLVGYGLEKEAIRVLKLIPDNWLPGLLNGQPVDVEVVIPFFFRLN